MTGQAAAEEADINKNEPAAGTRWLITGGCGFIGTNLIARLLGEGGQIIRVLDNLAVGTRDDLAAVGEVSEDRPDAGVKTPADADGICRLIRGDVRDPETCRRAAADVDIIVHLAANTGVAPSVDDPAMDMETNVRGTFNMLEAARQQGVKRFIFASSGAPVGECRPPVHEELAPHPVSPYGAGKLAGEGYCSAYFHTFGVNTVALRFGNVYGPGSSRKGSVVARFIKRAMAGRPLEIYGDGAQTRDFIYIDDLVRAIILSSRAPDIGGEIFQIATSRETTVNELAEALVPLLNQAGLADIRIINGEERIGDVRRNFSDTTKAAQRLGWQCRYDLSRGLAETVSYFIRRQSR
ncbi:MAG: NAD-dependent epimerase/dehydratase family protein [Desulfosudaceae bacterium]